LRISYVISKIVKKLYIPAIIRSKVSKNAFICSGSHVVDSILGDFSYIGNYCTVINTEVGKFCSIADYCVIGGTSHPIKWVSTSPVFHEGKNVLRLNFSNHEFKTSEKTVIGNDVWIGNNCLIRSGVTINHGAIVGMGSVVTKNIGPYEIWAGNPARFLKKRFPDESIELLLNIEWWNFGKSSLFEQSKYFNNLEEFLRIHSLRNDI
jgi:acetyltransferase-like isoleucine patch superfamily enzyme